MTREEFEQLVEEEFEKAIPEKFRGKIKNVAFLVEDNHPELLGLYNGIPMPMRGDWYGMGATLPDTITLFQKPIENEASQHDEPIRKVIRETIWHEVAHHFGMDEEEVQNREDGRN